MIIHHFMGPGLAACVAAFMTAWSAVESFAQPDQTELVFVGSGHRNIAAFRLNLTSGALSPIGEVAQVEAPSFLAISPNQRNLYAVSEGRGKDDSFVSAFRIDSETGKLAFLNRQPSGGDGPCHVGVDPGGLNVLAANYGSGSVSEFHLDKSGALGPISAFVQDHGSGADPRRQAGPHAHCFVASPDGRFAFVCDLGLDRVLAFKLNPSTGSLAANDPPFATVKAGAGPRHMAFHPNHRYACAINEMASTLTVFAYDQDRGILSEIEDQPLLPKEFKGQNTAAEVAVHPSGRFVYASIRGDDSLVVFACDPDTGRLTFVERCSSGGKTPRHFEIEPSGAFLLVANQNSGTINVFRVDAKTGRLQPTGSKAVADMPMCVKCLRLTTIKN
jgi:6-phosphogluconolactonase